MSHEPDQEFLHNSQALLHAISLMGKDLAVSDIVSVGAVLPESGLGSIETLDQLAPIVLGHAARLGAPTAFAHKDPPTPWVTWATTLWNASLNQNLLHPATAPVARQLEEKVIAWLCPYFGMTGGHMTPGSSAANLTALWAARECAGITEVVASDSAHLSIKKAANILGLHFTMIPTDAQGVLCSEALPQDMSRSALVLTSGTTSAGALDPLDLIGRAAWTHVDAAWGGPLRFTRFADRLSGIEHADSVAVSSHNVGLLGSHGATAIPLLAMLMSWGREGVAQRIEHCMALADELAEFIRGDARLELFSSPKTGIVVWRAIESKTAQRLLQKLPAGMISTVTIDQHKWLRNTAANPNVDMPLMIETIKKVLNEA